MFQNKTTTFKVLTVSLLIFFSSSVFADQSCRLSSEDKEQFALARAWKSLDGDLKKRKYSAEWSLGANTKAQYGEQLESKAEDKSMKCGLKFHHDLLHNPKGVGIRYGIKRYQEIFLRPFKDKPEIYFNTLKNMTCPTAEDEKIRDEYKKAQQLALNNLSYIVYHRLVLIKGEDKRHSNDLEIASELKAQLDAIKPEVIRVGADLEFLKRAEVFANSLEESLKTKPEVMCQKNDSLGVKAVDGYYDTVKAIHNAIVK